MFFFFPIGVEEAAVDRVPWVSVGLAGACLVAFAVTYLAPAHPTGDSQQEVRRVLQFWEERPYLVLPERFKQRHLNARGVAAVEREHGRAKAPSEADLKQEQAALEQVAEGLQAVEDGSLMRRFALVPARGFYQPGWLTHMFLHLGWMHLIGNFFFFYLVGPLLEDAWGRPLFAGFYLLGGLMAGISHYALNRFDGALMVGASGAIAACMGAFALRCAARKVRMAYFLWFWIRIRRGTFLMPAWLWAGLWFGSEVLDFWLHRGNNGVAVMAHIGGFGFGFATALGLRLTGIEARHVAPRLEQKVGWTQHPGNERAAQALEAEDVAAAERLYQGVLAEQPANSDAQVGLARIELRSGRSADAHRRLEGELQRQLARGVPEVLGQLFTEMGPLIDLNQLRPQVAFRVAGAMESGPEEGRGWSEKLYLSAGRAGGPLGAKALLRAAQLSSGRPGGANEALAHAQAAQAMAADAPELRARIDELVVQLSQVATGLPIDEAPPEARPAAPAPLGRGGEPRIISCRLVARQEGAVVLQAEGGRARVLPLKNVVAIAVGAAQMKGPDGTVPKNLLFTDLVTSWGSEQAGPTVLRMSSAQLGLQQLFPGTPPHEAYGKLLADLLSESGAVPLPNAESISARTYPRFPDLASLNAAFYGGPN